MCSVRTGSLKPAPDAEISRSEVAELWTESNPITSQWRGEQSCTFLRQLLGQYWQGPSGRHPCQAWSSETSPWI